MEPSPFAEIHRRLLKTYILRHGALPRWVAFDPITQLVLAILDSRTRESVAKGAFQRLRQKFERWDALLDVPAETITQLIKPVTFADKKAVHLKEALQTIHLARGALTLDFLERQPVETARTWLQTLPGVGPKISAAVVNFSTLHMPALVVSTHYLRVAKRLGLIAPNATDQSANVSLAQLIPSNMTADDLQQNYFLVKRHGQSICRSSSKRCGLCCLFEICSNRKSNIS